MCDAACQLISVYNKGMSATHCLKSVILKRGGLKKVGLQRLSSLYNCMGYKATNTMFEKFGNDFDRDLKVWKEAVEKAELQSHRRAMHPGYYFTGDNVDIRCKPRQMTLKNQNKDNHMFHWVAFENRVNFLFTHLHLPPPLLTKMMV